MITSRFLSFAALCFSLSYSVSSVFAEPRVAQGFVQGFAQDEAPHFSNNVRIDAAKLCDVASNTLNYINEHADDSYAVHDGEVVGASANLTRVKSTLRFICKVHQEDKATGRDSRLNDPAFLTQHFEFIRWYPDKTTASKVAKKSTNQTKAKLLNQIPQDEIFLTKYYTKLLTGSAVQTSEYSQALYALPFDEQGLTPEQAQEKQHSLTRFKYTRQDIINGALLKNKLAKPLVWITEEALHDVLLQGTGVLQVGDKTRYFNVHRNNGIAYDYHIGKREQARYWYFAEVPSIMGYGKTIHEKVALAPHVSVAGNVKQLGLGKLFLFDYQTQGKGVSQLAILADEGGAFDNNLFQLDLLVDSYHGWSDYHKANKHLPDYVKAWILVAKTSL